MGEHQVRPREFLFSQLVLMFSATAMQNLGQRIHPATGKAEVDLPGAQFAIDMLEMLETRTQGNLGESETRMLREALTSARLNYVETAARHSAPTGSSAAPVSRTEPVPSSDGAAASKEESKPSGGDAPRYRKTYG